MPGLAVRPGDLVVPDRDPRVLVGDRGATARPRAVRRRGSSSMRRHRRTATGGARPAAPGPARRLAAMTARSDAEAARPASPPTPRRHGRLGRPDPGPRRRRAVGEHLAAGADRRTTRTERFPAILEMIPYGKDNWRRNADIGAWRVVRGARLRLVPGRRPRHRLVGGRRARRVHRGRDARRVRRGRVARGPALVQRRGRDVGHQLRRRSPRSRSPSCGRRTCARSSRSMGTDDRYLTDVHYIGGCVTASELSQYAVSQVAMNAMPPDAGLRGARLARRVAGRGSRRRRRGCSRGSASRPTGRTGGQGSLAPDYDAIEAAILNIGGWMRRLRRPGVPDAGALHGPVAGRSSATGSTAGRSDATPGPNLDELHEVVRFFDRWLKGDRQRRR